MAGLGIYAVLIQLPAYFPVQTQGVVELVLRGDHAARGLDGGFLVDKLTGAGGDARLAARITVVAAFRTRTCDNPNSGRHADVGSP